ncbi:MAG: hypothetical protein HQM16_07285 [Deltaproteobacteria bacterium]|nr:hypothetical protein [Deltaproteobacteria bacterium]
MFTLRLIVFLVMTAVCFVSSATAGGPLYKDNIGLPSSWDNSTAIDYHPESGTCGAFSNAEMLAFFETALEVWTDIDEVELAFNQEDGQIGQVGVDNYDDYVYLDAASPAALLTDNINPVLFDDDAEITAEIAGEANQYLVLGFAAPAAFTSDYTEITDGQAVINCRCLTDHPSGPCYLDGGQGTVEVSESELEFTVVHEMGHFINLDHSITNDNYYGTATEGSVVPIMYPVSFEAEGGLSARTDDIASLALIYPSLTDIDESWCLVTGTLLDEDGNEVQCVAVTATASSVVDSSLSVGSVSGSFAISEDENSDGDAVDDGECSEYCGYFEMYLRAGYSYTLETYEIYSGFTGGSSVGPCINAQKSVTAEEVTTVDEAQCVAGTTIGLGTFTLTGVSSSGGGGDDDDDGGGGGGGGGGSIVDDSVENPVGYWDCSLSQVRVPHLGSGRGNVSTTNIFTLLFCVCLSFPVILFRLNEIFKIAHTHIQRSPR